jgi:hypothetical protein
MGVHELTEEERAQMMEQALKKMKIRRIPCLLALIKIYVLHVAPVLATALTGQS